MTDLETTQATPTTSTPAQSGLSFVGTPEQLGALFGALAAAQGLFAPPVKDRTVKIPLKNGGGYSFTYADLGSLVDATRPALAANGLCWIAPWCRVASARMTLHATLAHAGGARITAEFTTDVPALYDDAGAVVGDDVKTLGASQTYLGRYAYRSLLGLPGGEDLDDVPVAGRGEGEQQQPAQATPKARPPARPPAGWTAATNAPPPDAPTHDAQVELAPENKRATATAFGEMTSLLRQLGYSTQRNAQERITRALGRTCPAQWLDGALWAADVDAVLMSLVAERAVKVAT